MQAVVEISAVNIHIQYCHILTIEPQDWMLPVLGFSLRPSGIVLKKFFLFDRKQLRHPGESVLCTL